jgi:hypothetical protein
MAGRHSLALHSSSGHSRGLGAISSLGAISPSPALGAISPSLGAISPSPALPSPLPLPPAPSISLPCPPSPVPSVLAERDEACSIRAKASASPGNGGEMVEGGPLRSSSREDEEAARAEKPTADEDEIEKRPQADGTRLMKRPAAAAGGGEPSRAACDDYETEQDVYAAIRWCAGF